MFYGLLKGEKSYYPTYICRSLTGFFTFTFYLLPFVLLLTVCAAGELSAKLSTLKRAYRYVRERVVATAENFSC